MGTLRVKYTISFLIVLGLILITLNQAQAKANNETDLKRQKKKHTFISTGMSTMKQISDAVKIFRKHKCPFELMHTISTYPMDEEDANLNRIKTLRDKFGCNVGYSGHEVGLAVSYAAAALGITSLERHITLDRTMYGTDQAA